MDHISSFTAHTNKSYEFVLHQMKHFYENTSVLAQFEEVLFLVCTVQHNSSYRIASHRIYHQAHKSQSSCFRGDRCHLHFAALTWIYWNRHARRFLPPLPMEPESSCHFIMPLIICRYADKVYKIENSELLLDDVCRYMSKKRRYQRQIPQSK